MMWNYIIHIGQPVLMSVEIFTIVVSLLICIAVMKLILIFKFGDEIFILLDF